MSSVIVSYAQVFPLSDPICNGSKALWRAILSCTWRVPAKKALVSCVTRHLPYMPLPAFFTWLQASPLPLFPTLQSYSYHLLCTPLLPNTCWPHFYFYLVVLLLGCKHQENKNHVVFIYYWIPCTQHFAWQKISTQILIQFIDKPIDELI